MKRSYKFLDFNDKLWEFSSDSTAESFLNDFALVFALEEISCPKDYPNRVIFTENLDNFKELAINDGFNNSKLIDNSHVKICIHPTSNIICLVPPLDSYCYPETSSDEKNIGTDFKYDYSGVGFKRVEIIRVFIALCLLGGIRFGMPIHSAMLGFEENGLLISGPSGMGKSTCAKRATGQFKAYCDDISIIAKNERGDFFVTPLPTYKNCFEHSNLSSKLPLRAIFFLIQSSEDYTQRMDIRQGSTLITEAIRVICNYNLCCLPENDKREIFKQIFHSAYEITKKIPIYYLFATNSIKYMKSIEKTLSNYL